jgi:peptidoglycan/xylan/chitin deacetylase (PgdA/CDA1 family)
MTIPTNPQCTQITGAIQVTWVEGANPADQYQVWKSVNSGTYSLLTTILSGIQLYNDTAATNLGDLIKYKIRGKNGLTVSNFSSPKQITSRTWSELMQYSYTDVINTHVTWTTAQKTLILGRLQEQYIIDTFGPAGQNKTVCDFFIFLQVNPAYLTHIARTITKSGATLRWNFGGGNIYSQNNLPAQTSTTEVSFTSTDGFSGVTALSLNPNGFINNIFKITYYFPNATTIIIAGDANGKMSGNISSFNFINTAAYINLSNNLFIGDLSAMTIPDSCGYFDLNSNLFTGTAPSISANHLGGGALLYYCYSNKFTGFGGSLVSRNTWDFQLGNNQINTTGITSIITKFNNYFSAHAPTHNLSITLTTGAHTTNGTITGGETNSDLVNLKAVFVNAGYTCTVTYNAVSFLALPLNVPFMAITFDDEYITQFTTLYPVLAARGLVGTLYVAAYHVGTAGYMTVSNLQALYAAGWDIQCHTYDHIDMTTLTQAQQEDQYARLNTFLTTNSIPSPNHTAYPYGTLNALVEQVAAEYRLTGRGVDWQTLNGLIYKDMDYYNLPVITWGTLNATTDTVVRIESVIDLAVIAKAGMISYLHTFVTNATGSDTDIDMFASFIDYAISQGVTVGTISQLYAKLIA